MRLAKIGREYDTEKFEVLATGAEHYNLEPGTTSVQLTDWPLIESQTCNKQDVYYTPVAINGKHFICKYATLVEKTLARKMERVKFIRNKLLDQTMFVSNRRLAKKLAIELGMPGVTYDLTDEVYKDFLTWSNNLALLTTLPNTETTVSSYNIDEITPDKSDIFGVIPDIKFPNGG